MQADLRVSVAIVTAALGCASRVTAVEQRDSGGALDTLSPSDVAVVDTYEGRMTPDARLAPCDDAGMCELSAFCSGPPLGLCCNGDRFDGGVCLCGEGLGCDALHECCLAKSDWSKPRRCLKQSLCF